jgi:hypothetical protein
MNLDIEIALYPWTTPDGVVRGDQTLHRGGLKQIGVSFKGTPVYVGDFSGGMPTADPHTGVITLENPPPPITKANYIIYNGNGRILMQPGFDWIKPVKDEDGPGFLYTAEPY